jgi:hypothetical protein
VARSVKQTAKAPLSAPFGAHRGVPGARGVRGATAPTPRDGRPGAPVATDGEPSPQSDWPIYAELVAELGDPTG